MSENTSTLNSIFKGIGSAVRSFSDGLNKAPEIKTPEVLSVLNEFQLKKTHCTSEKKLEDALLKFLNEKIGKAHAQYNIGGYLGLKIDMDLGDGQVGIELKMARELLNSANNIERLFGQVIYYSKRKYKNQLIVAVAGMPDERNQVIKEVEKFITELGVHFVWLEVK